VWQSAWDLQDDRTEHREEAGIRQSAAIRAMQGLHPGEKAALLLARKKKER
jgi:hypothetical protein